MLVSQPLCKKKKDSLSHALGSANGQMMRGLRTPGEQPALLNKTVPSSLRPPRVRIPLEPGFFFGSSHTSYFKIGTPVATLPGAWRYRVSTGTGRPGVSIL